MHAHTHASTHVRMYAHTPHQEKIKMQNFALYLSSICLSLQRGEGRGHERGKERDKYQTERNSPLQLQTTAQEPVEHKSQLLLRSPGWEGSTMTYLRGMAELNQRFQRPMRGDTHQPMRARARAHIQFKSKTQTKTKPEMS